MDIKDQLNRSLHDLRISLIDRCNFRCPYCMPTEQFNHSYQFLKQDQWLSFDEILTVARICVDLGVKKLRLTGGEPLLRPNLHELVAQLAKINGVEDLALTTNGSLLAEHALKLKQAGLKRLSISLDSLDPYVFKRLSGHRGHVEDILTAIEVAASAGFENIKINTVVQRGVNDHTLMPLVNFARDYGHTLRFIEYMDVGNQNHWDLSQVVPSQEILKNIQKHYPLKAVGGTESGETSLRFRFDDGEGEIGFISSVSQPFCRSCNRLRLSASGGFYTCLFATQGIDIKDALRSGASKQQVREIILSLWSKRQDRYSELRSQLCQQHKELHKVEMFQIGG